MTGASRDVAGERLEAVRKTAVLGHFHGGNLGDDCTVAAIVQNIRARCPHVEIIGFSNNPTDTRERHGIPTFPVQPAAERRPADESNDEEAADSTEVKASRRRRGPLASHLARVDVLRTTVRGLRRLRRSLAAIPHEVGFCRRSYRRLRGVELVIVAGSHPFADWWSGPWGHPYMMLRWALLSRLAGAAFVPLCVSAGPIRSRLSRLFLSATIRLSSYYSFRDANSLRVARELLGAQDVPIPPDLVFSLDIDEALREPDGGPAGAGAYVVGVNPMSYADPRYWPDGDAAVYNAYLGELAAFCRALAERGHQIRLFSSEKRADLRVMDDLEALLADADPAVRARVSRVENHDAESLLRNLASFDFVVATRFHSILIAQMLYKPTLAISYHEKTVDLMERMASPHWIHLEQLEAGAALDAFDRLVAERARTVAGLTEGVRDCRRQLDEQFDALLGSGEARERSGS